MAKFDHSTLQRLHDAREVSIRTGKHPDMSVVIWVVADDEDAFVRSVRGPRGRWYRDLAKGGEATLEVAGQRLPVRAIPAADDASVDRASREYLRKYSSSPYAPTMVRADTLPTTLRLEPR